MLAQPSPKVTISRSVLLIFLRGNIRRFIVSMNHLKYNCIFESYRVYKIMYGTRTFVNLNMAEAVAIGSAIGFLYG